MTVFGIDLILYQYVRIFSFIAQFVTLILGDCTILFGIEYHFNFGGLYYFVWHRICVIITNDYNM